MNSKATAAALTLAIPLAAVAQTSVEEKQSKIEQALESVLSKQGLSIGGMATGEYLNSSFTGAALKDSLRSSEQAAYTQVDFDLRARPNTSTTARAVMRMHLDWPNFWGAPSTPIETRWLSLDGKIADMFYYGVGDISAKWSQYSLWAPEVGFLYTPRIFAQKQEQAMSERFQGDNKRNLQGLQFGLRAAVPSINADSINVGFLGAKLATADHSAAEQLKAAYPFVWAPYDRILWGLRADGTFAKGVTVGLDFLSQADLKTSYKDQDTTASARLGRDSAQAGSVFGARLNVQIDKLAKIDGWKAGIGGEFAHSSWEKFSHNKGKDTVPELSGNGLTAGLKVGYVLPKTIDANLSIGYMSNDSAFRNDVAQSPTFHGGRILNTEQGWSSWNTFDAMYDNVYRFIPENKSNMTSKNAVEKNNYFNQVLTPSQVASGTLDYNLQMVLPGGQATANRVGPQIDLDAGFLDGAIDVKGAFYSLTEAKPQSFTSTVDVPNEDGTMTPVEVSVTADKASFTKMQAGAKIRADKFTAGAWDLPLELAFSYEQNAAKQKLAGVSVVDYKSTILNVGAYIGLTKRLSLLAGYQSIAGKNALDNQDADVVLEGLPVTNNQSNVGVGVEVKVQEGARLIAMWNKLTTEYPNLDNKNFEQGIANVKLQVAF